jgi:hypothetical protein
MRKERERGERVKWRECIQREMGERERESVRCVCEK